MSAKLAVMAVAALATVGLAAKVEDADQTLTSGGCTTKTEQVGPCAVEFRICYGFYKWKWRYTATACASGVCGESGHTASATTAAEDAARSLFAKGPACAVPRLEAADLAGLADVVLSVPSVVKEEKNDAAPALPLTETCWEESAQARGHKFSVNVCKHASGAVGTWFFATACCGGCGPKSMLYPFPETAVEEAIKLYYRGHPSCL